MEALIKSINFINNDLESKNDRIARACGYIESGNADLYMLPELWSVGFFSYDKFDAATESMDGKTVTVMRELAAKKKAYILMGSFLERRGENIYNTAVLIDRSGDICGKYSKLHLFGDEKKYLTPGNEACVCDTEFGKVGITICYDLRFPEQYVRMSEAGAEIFLSCAAWPTARLPHLQALTRARAIEGQAYCITCCSGGVNNGQALCGKTMAFAPDGSDIPVSAGERTSVTIQTDKIRQCREKFPFLRDRVRM